MLNQATNDLFNRARRRSVLKRSLQSIKPHHLLLGGTALLLIHSGPVRGEEALHNVSLSSLGATAKGSGSNFNKDWPARNVLNTGKKSGVIFSPFEGGKIDIRLVIPVEIQAMEIVGLDYRGTRQVASVDVYIEGEKKASVDLPDQPGKPFRFPLAGTGQHIQVVATGSHPVQTKKDGSKGPEWGGFASIRVLSPLNLEDKMAGVDNYSVTPMEYAIQSTQPAPDEVKVVGQPRQTQGHPNTLWDQQDIDHYKAMMKTSKKLKDQVESLQRAMDVRITEPLNVPAPEKNEKGEWKHLLERDVKTAHNKNALDIANLGTVYVLTGEEKYAEFAKKLLIAYADAFPHYAAGSRPGFRHDSGKLFDQRLGDATWLIQVARGYDLIYNLPSITEAERQHIENDILKAAANFIAANSHVLKAPTNWSAIATCAVLITGYATDDEELVNLALYGPGGTQEAPKGGVMMHFGERAIDEDGMWAEGAIGYQFMAMQALIADAEILWHHGIDMYRHRGGVLKKLFDSPLDFSYPDLRTPAINDSRSAFIVGEDAYLYEFGYRRYPDPKYLAILNQTGTRLAAKFQQFPVSILYDRDAGAAAEAVEWESTNFFGVGYGIQRHTDPQGTVNVLMDYGPNRSHGHPDKLNLDVWSNGEALMPDPGMVWYENPMYANWYKTSLAHNTLSVDELSQMDCGATQLVFAFGDSLSIQRAVTDEAFAGVIMDRGVFVTSRYMADLFGVFARLPRKLDLSWHLRGDFSSALAMEPFAFKQPMERGYNQLDELRTATTDQAWSATFTQGAESAAERGRARFLAAGGSETQVITGDGWFNTERPKTIIQRRETNSTVYGNVIEFDAGGVDFVKQVSTTGSLDEGYAAMHVETVAGNDYGMVIYRPGIFQSGEIETDALQVFVRTDKDGVYSMLMGGGTLLKFGSALIKRDSPGLVMVERQANGAFIVANLSDQPAQVEVILDGLKGFDSYALDARGKRVGQKLASSASRSVQLPMAAKQKIEFAQAGEPGVYEYRQAMLKQVREQQEALMRKEFDACVTRTQERIKQAEMNPAPASTKVVVEAERFVAQGGSTIKISETKAGAQAAALAGWDMDGHWIEWEVEVPAEAYYHLTIRYCSALSGAGREVAINGEVQEPFAPFVLPGTGGWANGSDDWRSHVLTNPTNEQPLLIRLKQGKNTIRLTNTNGVGANVDYLLITSPDATGAMAGK